MSCTNPGCSELLPAEKLDSHVNVNCSFRNITCDYCKEETAANQLKVSQDLLYNRVCTWLVPRLAGFILNTRNLSNNTTQFSNGALTSIHYLVYACASCASHEACGMLLIGQNGKSAFRMMSGVSLLCNAVICFISLLSKVNRSGTDTQVASCHCHPVVFHPIVDQLIVFYISGLVL